MFSVGKCVIPSTPPSHTPSRSISDLQPSAGLPPPTTPAPPATPTSTVPAATPKPPPLLPPTGYSGFARHVSDSV
ncbi:unnamed protein product [Lactuca virosa]|uniref:Uncharacterized protein n=1 Tax=Lactuca virosa TaxID=75947 RepID=A0AAU9ML46_9ASTR|nr:unnamed protein product [Lactuca virosa]